MQFRRMGSDLSPVQPCWSWHEAKSRAPADQPAPKFEEVQMRLSTGWRRACRPKRQLSEFLSLREGRLYSAFAIFYRSWAAQARAKVSTYSEKPEMLAAASI